MKKLIQVQGKTYPYEVENLWNIYGDGEVVRVSLDELHINEEFALEDMPSILEFMIDSKLNENTSEKQQLSVRYYKTDIDFIKSYAQKKDDSYQRLLREAVRGYATQLKQEENIWV